MSIEKLKELRRAKGERFLVFFVSLAWQGMVFHCVDIWRKACERSTEGRTNCIFIGDGPLGPALAQALTVMPESFGDSFIFARSDVNEVLAAGDMVFLSEGDDDFNEKLRDIAVIEGEIRNSSVTPINGPAVTLSTIQATIIGGSIFPKSPIV